MDEVSGTLMGRVITGRGNTLGQFSSFLAQDLPLSVNGLHCVSRRGYADTSGQRRISCDNGARRGRCETGDTWCHCNVDDGPSEEAVPGDRLIAHKALAQCVPLSLPG